MKTLYTIIDKRTGIRQENLVAKDYNREKGIIKTNDEREIHRENTYQPMSQIIGKDFDLWENENKIIVIYNNGHSSKGKYAILEIYNTTNNEKELVNIFVMDPIKAEQQMYKAFFEKKQLKYTNIKRVYIDYYYSEIKEGKIEYEESFGKCLYKYELLNFNA